MADDAPKTPGKERTAGIASERLEADAGQIAVAIGHLIRSPPVDVERVRSGLLSPPHTPTGPEDGGQPPGAARARHPGEGKPLPSPGEIIDNPARFLPPAGDPGRDSGRKR